MAAHDSVVGNARARTSASGIGSSLPYIAPGYKYAVSIEHEEQAFEATERHVRRGFLIQRDALTPTSTDLE